MKKTLMIICTLSMFTFGCSCVKNPVEVIIKKSNNTENKTYTQTPTPIPTYNNTIIPTFTPIPTSTPICTATLIPTATSTPIVQTFFDAIMGGQYVQGYYDMACPGVIISSNIQCYIQIHFASGAKSPVYRLPYTWGAFPNTTDFNYIVSNGSVKFTWTNGNWVDGSTYHLAMYVYLIQ